MRKIFFLLGIVFTLSVLFLAGSTMAGPKQCPPGQRGNCHYYQQNTTGNYGCFPAKANLGNGWVKVSNKCPEKKTEEKKPTNTSKPVVIQPTNTVLPETQPTEKPKNTEEAPIEIHTGEKDKDGKEIVLVESMNQILSCPEDCICRLLEDAVWELDEIGEQLRINNQLQLTLNAALMTVVSGE